LGLKEEFNDPTTVCKRGARSWKVRPKRRGGIRVKGKKKVAAKQKEKANYIDLVFERDQGAVTQRGREGGGRKEMKSSGSGREGKRGQRWLYMCLK